MTRSTPWAVRLAGAVALILAAGGCYAAQSKLQIGDAAPGWADIVGTDDQKHALADYKEAKLLVLVFTTNHCPVAQAYQERLVAMAKDYQPKGVQVVAVNVNKIEPDRLEAMKKRAKEKGFNFPYLYDATQKIGRDYGAAVTPHVFVLDKDRKIAYIGAVNDNMNVEKVKKHYLREAVNALLAGKTPPQAVTTPVGCHIEYE